MTDVKNRESVSRKHRFPLPPVRCSRRLPRHLNFSTQKTMRIAQQLYEGVDIKGNGTVGVITYLRTDSTQNFRGGRCTCKRVISRRLTEKHMWPEGTRTKSGQDKKIQDAHEAIRPTDITQDTGSYQGFTFAEISSVCIS